MTKHLLVYNWKTGALLKNLNGELLSHEIVFVDDRHFLVPFMPHTLPGAYLAVVDCYRTDPDTNEAMTRGKIQDVIFKHASLLLQLPPVRDAPHIDYQEVHAMSSTGTQAERLHPPGRPFYVDYTKRIFVLSMLIGETWGRDRMHYTLLVPAPAILSRLGASGPGTPPMRAAEQHRCMMLPWAAWAPDARFMEDEMEDICSTRYLTSTRIDERRLVTVYDFASAPALLRDLRADGGGGGNTLSEPFSVPDPVPVPDEGGVFERCGVLTGAPCRRTVTDIALPDIRMVTDFISQGHRTVRLYEDGLVVYGPTIDSEVHVYAI
ncbi:uncharacterized protein PHACADRAFT_259223 [Phanerochaete carnosa HHB-10118-sp]|uniref:Uncharacterized protein n=1 Tax=Phanerochaete carnosa (strain HHB-10118-sp) TaxID=650164 RepID=K5VNL9_PHACS|nr:uncharacterized protein PHACADRAFT_259223 [Phanerochaete carnosa HHB-10118-sp]EKM53068.1 hypothetical protein PHACADRAFT_259223 [Phanerochaete carnosa HHB-10118-sp]